MSKVAGPRITTMDIETIPMELYNWSLWDEPRAVEKIVKDWAVYSVAAKNLNEKRCGYLSTQGRGDCRDDIDLMRWTREILDESDIVIGHNLAKFDLRKLRARMIKHGLKPFREPLVVDTLLMARDVGAFTSNKLEYLSALTNEVKSKHGKFPGFALWKGIMDDNPAAWAESRKYNIQDVVAEEQLYLLLRPWARRHPNVAHYFQDDKLRCPRCGSDELITMERPIFRGVSEYTQYQCKCCGGFSRSRFALNTKDKRKSLLSVQF